MTESTFADRSRPADVLMLLVVNLLAPVFRSASGGDIYFTRIAAFEMINQYDPRNQVDLIAISQVIACGPTALSSFGLALSDNLSLSMTLRLRSNGVAPNRAVEQARRAVEQASADIWKPEEPFVPDPNQAEYEEQVLADVAAATPQTSLNPNRGL